MDSFHLLSWITMFKKCQKAIFLLPSTVHHDIVKIKISKNIWCRVGHVQKIASLQYYIKSVASDNEICCHNKSHVWPFKIFLFCQIWIILSEKLKFTSKKIQFFNKWFLNTSIYSSKIWSNTEHCDKLRRLFCSSRDYDLGVLAIKQRTNHIHTKNNNDNFMQNMWC